MNKQNRTELIDWYQNLNADSVHKIHQYYAENTYFKDPFHEFSSLNPLLNLYKDMFKKLKKPRFLITKEFFNEDTCELVLFWDFTFLAFGKTVLIAGNTLFKFNHEGKINYHLDYWDSVSELWIKTPILGHAIKMFYKLVF